MHCETRCGERDVRQLPNFGSRAQVLGSGREDRPTLRMEADLQRGEVAEERSGPVHDTHLHHQAGPHREKAQGGKADN